MCMSAQSWALKAFKYFNLPQQLERVVEDDEDTPEMVARVWEGEKRVVVEENGENIQIETPDRPFFRAETRCVDLCIERNFPHRTVPEFHFCGFQKVYITQN